MAHSDLGSISLGSISHLDASERISLLSYEPKTLATAMINIPSSELPTCDATTLLPAKHDSSNGMGFLDRLPPDILLDILDTLGVQSLARLSATCSRANDVVKMHTPYRDIVTHAPHALVALRQLEILEVHSVSTLASALRTDRCALCAGYGAYLFLPTCARCCWSCQRYEDVLRVIKPEEARRLFALSRSDVERHLPDVNLVPRGYNMFRDGGAMEFKGGRMVSAKAALDLALRAHGDAQKLDEAVESSRPKRALGEYDPNDHRDWLTQVCGRDPDDAQHYHFRRMYNPGAYEYSHPPRPGKSEWSYSSPLFGMASVVFPSLDISGTVENGLWCRGCKITRLLYKKKRLPDHVIRALGLDLNSNEIRSLLGFERRAWSRAELLSHVENCYGVKELMNRLNKQSRDGEITS